MRRGWPCQRSHAGIRHGMLDLSEVRTQHSPRIFYSCGETEVGNLPGFEELMRLKKGCGEPVKKARHANIYQARRSVFFF